VIGCVAIQWLTTQIGTQQTINSNLVLGAILVVFVLMVPKGIVPTLGELGMRLFGAVRRTRPSSNDTRSVAPDDAHSSSREEAA
jgi:branched-chain amino acid transport system permease protein